MEDIQIFPLLATRNTNFRSPRVYEYEQWLRPPHWIPHFILSCVQEVDVELLKARSPHQAGYSTATFNFLVLSTLR